MMPALTVTVALRVEAPLSSGSAMAMLALVALRVSVALPSLTVTLLAVMLPGSLILETNSGLVLEVTL